MPARHTEGTCDTCWVSPPSSSAFTLRAAFCALCSVLCALCSLLCALCYVLCALCSLLSTRYCLCILLLVGYAWFGASRKHIQQRALACEQQPTIAWCGCCVLLVPPAPEGPIIAQCVCARMRHETLSRTTLPACLLADRVQQTLCTATLSK